MKSSQYGRIPDAVGREMGSPGALGIRSLFTELSIGNVIRRVGADSWVGEGVVVVIPMGSCAGETEGG